MCVLVRDRIDRTALMHIRLRAIDSIPNYEHFKASFIYKHMNRGFSIAAPLFFWIKQSLFRIQKDSW